MMLMVFDEDVDEHDIIGGCQIPFDKLCAKEGMDEWIEIMYRNEPAGKVHVRAKWTEHNTTKRRTTKKERDHPSYISSFDQ